MAEVGTIPTLTTYDSNSLLPLQLCRMLQVALRKIASRPRPERAQHMEVQAGVMAQHGCSRASPSAEFS